MFKVYKQGNGDYFAINKASGEHFATEHWHVFQQELKARLDNETVASEETKAGGEVTEQERDKRYVKTLRGTNKRG